MNLRTICSANAAASLALILGCGDAFADEIRLSNGDRLSGTVVSMEKDELVLKTDYAGEIKIDWRQVESLSAGERLEIQLRDGSSVEGRAQASTAGRLTLEADTVVEPITVSLGDVQAINPEEKPALRVTGIANAGVTTERGNTDTDSIRFDASVVARADKSRYSVGGELNREKADGEDTANNWHAYAGYDYFFLPKWFWYAHSDFEHDEFADLKLRTRLGTGLGYQVFESELRNLSISAGPSFVNEDFDRSQDDSFAAGQWFINYDQFVFDEFAQVFHSQKGHVSLEDAGNWVINTRQGVRFPLYKGLTATLQYNYDYRNEPSASARSNYDSTFLFLLGWQFRN